MTFSVAVPHVDVKDPATVQRLQLDFGLRVGVRGQGHRVPYWIPRDGNTE